MNAAPKRQEVRAGVPGPQARAALTAVSAGPGVDRDDAATPAPPKKKRGKRLVVALLVVALLAGGGLVVRSRLRRDDWVPGQPVPPGQVFAVGTLTANTSDGHLVQAAIDIQLSSFAEPKTAAADSAQLKNAAIGDLSGWTSPELLRIATRDALQRQLLASFQQVLGTVDGGAPQALAVYFTSFLVQ